MGFIRTFRRLYRQWKVLVYILAFVLVVQVLIALNTNPSLLEDEQIRRLKEIERLKLQRAPNAVLLGERPLIDEVQNPKDPRVREQFLKHAGNGIGILEDESLKDQKKNHAPRYVIRGVNFDEEQRDSEALLFQPICEVNLKDAQSSISRAKTAMCKQEIADVACQMQEKTLFPKSMPRTCPHKHKFVHPAPMPSNFPDTIQPVRICYILIVHGRSLRQLRRLLRVIYHRQHYYYIHVDKRSNYLLREIVKETAKYPNVRVASWQMATIWGGSSLLQMLLRALKEVLMLWSDWDFFINLSGLDFPIEKNEKLTKFLALYRDKNFMKSHGREDEKFIRKQGLNRVFVECDQHMWRLGERDLPEGLIVNGGSDWVALNRELCHYVINGKDKLLSDLKHWYKYTLLPAESFFHTFTQNSDKCETFVDNNLRVTNWNRARGCKCQYKHIVDWCGCSPNDFYPSDLGRLQTSRPVFFARKFEEIINQEVLNHLDFKLYGEYPPGTPGLNSYWENCYDHLDGLQSVSDAHLSHYISFARLGLDDLNKQLDVHGDEQCSLNLGELYQVEVYKRSEEFLGYLITIGAAWQKRDPVNKTAEQTPDVRLEVYISHKPNFRILDDSSQLARRLEGAMVGTNWDVKELVLRDWGGIIGPNSEPRLVARWRKGDDDFVVTVVIIDPLNVVADYNDFRTPSKAAGVTETPLSLRKPLRPGRWTVRFYIQRQFTKACAEVDFFVGPLQYKKGVEGGKELSTDNRGVEDDSQLNGAGRSLYSIRTTLGLSKDMTALQDLVSSSTEVAGSKLASWIDAILGQAWKPKDICLVGKMPEQWKASQPKRCGSARQNAPNQCENMNWSSFSPDPKSRLGVVKPNGRIR